ncbi:MAG: thioredoxin-dependent thiol peroxidase [Rhodospirillaceae bacterium]|nr:thioredoxin-dependent thiol peroxidase [Rhodospirillaceae bacterium]
MTQPKGTGPQEGDRAPDFSLPSDDGTSIALKDFRGKNVVLYFYPKDDTSGCTKEAIGFTEALKDFATLDAVVLGASRDSVAKHQKFKDKHDLGVTLISDEEGSLCSDYGVWVEKSMYGRTYMGIERATFLIDKSGKVKRVWRKVKIRGHVEEVLDAASAMT